MIGACSSGCLTPGQHASWGECIRAKALKIGYCRSAAGFDATREKKWDKELADYRDARAQGIQPGGTTTDRIEHAVRASNEVGVPYDASGIGQASDPFTQKVLESL